MAVMRDAPAGIGSQVRWMPRGATPAKPLAKVDPARGNAALHGALTEGTLCLIYCGGHADERALDVSLAN
eukprot:6619028-Pyramimonas_sp.AAC.1